jgi:alkyldihydroxyacetonephosphate synthase
MQRWNGWGDMDIQMDLPPEGLAMLQDLLGKGRNQPDYPLKKLLEHIPDSRLPEHPLISVDPKLRLDHAHGQSLPDWIRMRGGTLRRFPDGVAQPATIEEIQEILQFATENDIIVIPFGGGTSVVGHLEVPATKRPILSLALHRFNRLIRLEPANLLATFEAGVRGPDLEKQLKTKGFTLGHYPQSFEYSSLGGWVITRSSGQQSRHYGRIEKLFAGGEVLTPQGPMQLPPFPASAAGPDLRQLLLGSEGRIGVLTKVIVRISRLPEKDDIYAVFFPSWDHAKEGVQELAGSSLLFSMIRLSNSKETRVNLSLARHFTRPGLYVSGGFYRFPTNGQKYAAANVCYPPPSWGDIRWKSHRKGLEKKSISFSLFAKYPLGSGLCCGYLGNGGKLG